MRPKPKKPLRRRHSFGPMRRLTRVGLLLALTGAVTATTADRHMRLTNSHPAADTTITESPPVVQAWYSQDPELSVSRLSLRGPDGVVQMGETRLGEDRSLMATIPHALTPGRYTVNWRTAGDDGHVMRGTFAFTVAVAGQ